MRKAKNASFISEMWSFLKERKAWWLIPTIIMLLIMAILIIFGQTSAVSPFIYTLF